MTACAWPGGCPTEKLAARGLCSKHYARVRRKERNPETGKYVSPRQARIDAFLVTGLAKCDTHGEHRDWIYRTQKHPKGAYRGLRCGPCTRTATRAWKARNPDHEKPYYRSVRGKAAGLVGGARRRAEKAGLPFSISAAWVVEQFDRQGGRCAYTGWEFDNTLTGRGYARNIRGMSLDRVDSAGGYTPDNVRLVCWGINRMKSDWAMKDFLAACAAVAEHSDWT